MKHREAQQDIYAKILKEYWGFDDVRGIQREIITSIGEGRDTLGLMPTGGGKSITFQVPTLARKGLCLVITPLIALMKDQVANLRSRNIKAAAIYSGMKHAAAITSQTGKARLPTHINIAGGSVGLSRDSVILLEQIRTIDKRRLREHMGRLSQEQMHKVDNAIAVSFGLQGQQ